MSDMSKADGEALWKSMRIFSICGCDGGSGWLANSNEPVWHRVYLKK